MRGNTQMMSRKDRTIEELTTKLAAAETAERNDREELLALRSKYDALSERVVDLQNELQASAKSAESEAARVERQTAERQKDWKLDRVTRENKALEQANGELRSKLDDLKDENLQVSEKILLLDEELRQLKLREADVEGRVEAALAEKAHLATTNDELRSQVAEKISLLEEFEAKFSK